MTAKEYLSQIEKKEELINSKKAVLEELWDDAKGIRMLSFDERIKSSPSENGGSQRTIEKIIDLEREINAEISDLVDLKLDALEKICSLENEIYRKILIYLYLKKENLSFIADSIVYLSKRHVERLHGQALQAFQSKYLSN